MNISLFLYLSFGTLSSCYISLLCRLHYSWRTEYRPFIPFSWTIIVHADDSNYQNNLTPLKHTYTQFSISIHQTALHKTRWPAVFIWFFQITFLFDWILQWIGKRRVQYWVSSIWETKGKKKTNAHFSKPCIQLLYYIT